MEGGIKPIGYHRWNKERLNKFIRDRGLTIVESPGRAGGRKQLVDSIKNYVHQFKNTRGKSTQELLSLIQKYDIGLTEPSGRNNSFIKKDYVESIRGYWQNVETIQQVDFEGAVPRMFGNSISNFELRVNRPRVDYINFFNDNKNKTRDLRLFSKNRT